MSINSRAIRRGATTVFAAVAAMGALGACSSPQTGSAAPSQGAASASEPTRGVSNAAAERSSVAGRQENTKSPATSEPECTKLKVTLSQPTNVDDDAIQRRMPILLTNQGRDTCVVRGFPEVTLEGEDGTSWELMRTNGPAEPVLVAPGEHASADLTYLTMGSDADNAWLVGGMSVTPPNTTDAQNVVWPEVAAIVKQDGATHPGTYIAPVEP